jgi:hypothetical protein
MVACSSVVKAREGTYCIKRYILSGKSRDKMEGIEDK